VVGGIKHTTPDAAEHGAGTERVEMKPGVTTKLGFGFAILDFRFMIKGLVSNTEI
jgi:hypothetical protein